MRSGGDRSWWGPMLGFFFGAFVVALLEGPLLVGLLVGGGVALLWRPLRRDSPFTPLGRAAWRRRARNALERLRGLGLWLRLLRRGAVRAAPPIREPLRGDLAMGRRFDAVVRVRCEVRLDRIEVWHSVETGRAYEVLPRDSFAAAAPGLEGWLSFEGGRPRVRPLEAAAVAAVGAADAAEERVLN